MYGTDLLAQSDAGLGFLCVALLFYFLPTFVAVARKHRNAVPIFIVNLLLGWSFVGWVVALAWAFTARD